MSIRTRLGKLEPREQRLLTILLAVLGVGLFLLVPLLIYSAVSSRRDRNAEIRDVTARIVAARVEVADKKARHEALIARYAKTAPPLAGFIEEAARGQGITVPESQDKPEIPHGKRYSERLTVVRMHKVGLLALVRMFEKIEQSGYPVAITRLNLKPRAGEPDSYEVELGVSAYDRKEAKDSKASPASSAAAGEREENP